MSGIGTTRWTLVRRARRDDAEGRRALDELCRLYWPPVYTLFRREGLGAEDAGEHTQGLFLDLLERGDLTRADPARGRFRAFLYGCARHYLGKQRELAGALKRGGGRTALSFDFAREEDHLRFEPVDGLDPARAFDRRWAQTVIEVALARLEDDERQAGRAALFDALRPALAGEEIAGGYAAAAERLGMTEGALKVAAHRLRRRFRHRLQRAAGDTLEEPGEADAELRELLAALSA